MEEEIKALIKNGMWTLAKPPKDRHIIDSKWVLRIKRDGNGNLIPSRLVLLLEFVLKYPVLIFKIHLVLT